MLQNNVWFCTSSKKKKKSSKATLLIGFPTSSSFGSCLAMLLSKETVGFFAVSRMSCTFLSPRSSRPLARIPTLITPFSIRAELSVLPRKIKIKTSRAEITAQFTRRNKNADTATISAVVCVTLYKLACFLHLLPGTTGKYR